MSSWFSGAAAQVNSWVKEGPRHAAPQLRSADEQAADLEAQARRVTTPNAVAELLSKWVERIDSGHGTYQLGRDSLSYYQVLLRSRAFEVLLDTCCRIAVLRQALRGKAADGGIVGRALHSVVERTLLPGAVSIWPTLLEVLLASFSSNHDGAENAGGSIAPRELRCGQWARRALFLLKRRWQSEALPASLQSFDRRLASVGKEANPGTEHSLMPTLNQRMSKNGIRRALSKDKLQRCSSEATRLGAQLDINFDACSHLSALAGDGGSSGSAAIVAEVERLLQEADTMLTSLDTGVKERNAEQDTLKEKIGEVDMELKRKIEEVDETLKSFSEKRAKLQEEHLGLSRRLEELTLHLEQLGQAKTACEKEGQQLRLQLRDRTNRFEDRISGSFIQQKRLAEEKTRAVTCKECGHMALDIIRREDKRFGEMVSEQLRKRKVELRRSCTAYVRQERMRFNAAVECLATDSSSPKATSSGSAVGGDEDDDSCMPKSDRVKVLAIAEDAWRGAYRALSRLGPLLGDQQVRACREASAEVSAPTLAASAGREVVAETAADDVQTAEDAPTFFARAAKEGQRCADCGIAEADWASVSFGTYLCLDCAGRHRGLGVHVSFVRSTTMDMWNREQLRRMQLGGTEKFMRFLKPYSQLYCPPQTAAEFATRYRSRAVAHYRLLLDSLCEGHTGPSEQPPPPEEGHLPAQFAANSAGSSSGAVQTGSSGIVQGEAAGMSLEQERTAFEEVYHKHRDLFKGTDMASMPENLSDTFAAAEAGPSSQCTIPPPDLASDPSAAKALASVESKPSSKTDPLVEKPVEPQDVQAVAPEEAETSSQTASSLSELPSSLSEFAEIPASSHQSTLRCEEPEAQADIVEAKPSAQPRSSESEVSLDKMMGELQVATSDVEDSSEIVSRSVAEAPTSAMAPANMDVFS